MHRPPAVHRLTRRVWIAALVLPALLLVAMAARSYQPFGSDAEGGERIAWSPFFDSVFTIVAVFFGLALIVAVWGWYQAIKTTRRGGGSAVPYSSLLVFLGIVLFLAVAGRNVFEYRRRPASSEGLDPAFPQQLPTHEAQQSDYPRDPHFIWPLAIGVVVLIVAAIVAVVLVERRRKRRRVRTPEQLEQLVKALDEAIDDLRRDPDPRRAVIAAYARMEQALTVFGLPRKPAEAPYEYLHRVAKELEAEGPVEALTELFEVAKFSEHAVDETMRGRAIDALTAVRAEVRTAAAT